MTFAPSRMNRPMSKKPLQNVLPYFELLCFVAAWAVGLSVAWTSTRDLDEQPTARFAASDHPGTGTTRTQ